MCGGHGLHHLIGALVAGPALQRVDVTNEVKLMYVRGDISRETFHHLMIMAEGGDLSQDELLQMRDAVQHEQSPSKIRTQELEQQNQGPQDPKLSELEAQLIELQSQAQDAEAAARRPHLSDEEIRAYLETRQGALFRAEAVQRRWNSARQRDD